MTNTIATTNTATPGVGDNSAGRLDAMKRDMSMLGKAEAMGEAARPQAGLKLADYAFNGIIGPDDAETAYDTYLGGIARISAKNPLVAGQTKGSRNAQISKMRSFIKVGALPAIDGRETLARASTLVNELTKAGTKTLSPYDALLAVCREQLANPDRLLTEEELTAAVCKPEKAEKELMEKLVDEYKRLHKLHEVAQMPGTGAAVSAMADAIVEAGGEVPAVTKEEKDMLAFMAKARAMGFMPMQITDQSETANQIAAE